MIISIDMETFGHVPGKNSMVSLGAVAYTDEGEVAGDFYVNIKELPETTMCPSTKKFWNENKDAFQALSNNAMSPLSAITKFYVWLGNFTHYTFMGYNVAYDVAFLRYYFDWAFGDSDKYKVYLTPIELRSFMMGAMGIDWKETAKHNWDKLPFAHLLREDSLVSKNLHHHALFDADLQGRVFWWVMNERK